MNRYPQPTDFQSERIEPQRKRPIFETSRLRLLPALLIPILVSYVFDMIMSEIAFEIYSTQSSMLGFDLYRLLSPVIAITLSCLCAFLFCNSKKEGMMLLGLRCFVSAVFNVPGDIAAFFADNESGVYEISTGVISFLSFAALIALALFLTKSGEKADFPEPENGFFSVKRKRLVLAAGSITGLRYLVPIFIATILSRPSINIDSLMIIRIQNLTDGVLFLALAAFFCARIIRSRRESLIFFGVFLIGDFVYRLFDAAIQVIKADFGINAEQFNILSIIKICLVIALEVFIVFLLTKEKKAPETAEQISDEF